MPGHCCPGPAAYPGASSGPLYNAPLFGLAPGGVYRASPVARAAVSSYLAFSPLPLDVLGAVCFLWHFPWGHPRSPLATTLPCGARTFLPSRVSRGERPPDPLPQPLKVGFKGSRILGGKWENQKKILSSAPGILESSNPICFLLFSDRSPRWPIGQPGGFLPSVHTGYYIGKTGSRSPWPFGGGF